MEPQKRIKDSWTIEFMETTFSGTCRESTTAALSTSSSKLNLVRVLKTEKEPSRASSISRSSDEIIISGCE